MKCIKGISCVFIASTFVLSLQSCNGRQTKHDTPTNDTQTEVLKELSYTYNFYIENSGSVKGYFYGNSNDTEVIIKEFYDRIDEQLTPNEKITLNYINNTITRQNVSVDKWLNASYSKCNAKYSDLDQVLEQTLKNTDNKTVNFVVSDYCFESREGDLRKAQSGITKIFTKALNDNKDLSVSIYKYEASFNGYYFPGRIQFNGNRPLYVWIFGPSDALRKISKLNTTQPRESELYLQSHKSFNAKVITNNKRMSRDGSYINVKDWDNDRHQADLFKANLKVKMNNNMLPKSAITNIDNYRVTPNNFYIEDIQYEADGEYIYTIATNHPSPCSLKINYALDIPKWVQLSNFEQNTLPKDSTTYGIKYLIEGVADAYKNQNLNIFDVNLILK